MPDLKRRMDKLLFDHQTTYRTDFRGGKIKPPTFTLFKEKPTSLWTNAPSLKDTHTLTAWREKAVPFSLMHRPRDIVGQDPTKVQQPYVKPPDDKLEETIKTRPRLVMTPAVSMDDIEDPRARKILCDNMYLSNMTKATMEVSADYFAVRSPFPGLPARANPITLPKLQYPYVAPEWRMETISWDNKQLRSYCDATKEFWLREKVPFCRACKESEIITANRKHICQMKTGKQG